MPVAHEALGVLPLVAKDTRGNLIRAFKASGCANCGVRYPHVDWSELDIDHIDPTTKYKPKFAFGDTRSVTNFYSSGTETLLRELLKCQVLCKPCHKEKHRNGDGPTAQQLALFNGHGQWHYGGLA